jgi:hypothetical protein
MCGGSLKKAMNEDLILDAAINVLMEDRWHLAYKTRALTGGAFPGVDAILYSADLAQFRLVDAKGDKGTPVGRSSDFVNCLGSLVKRIRFNSGYLHLEARSHFTPPAGMTVDEFRGLLRERASHRNCEYWLALPATMRQTILDTLDPVLAGLLRIRVLLVDGTTARPFDW